MKAVDRKVCGYLQSSRESRHLSSEQFEEGLAVFFNPLTGVRRSILIDFHVSVARVKSFVELRQKFEV